jgi:DNA-binding transcriptional LysR family regulator
LNFRQLEIFRAVMQTGSVTGAARALNLSQPAVTKILQHAESQLRFALFDRVKGRLLPTQEAQALFPDVERVFEDLRDVRRMVKALQEARSGALTIVTIPTLGQAALPRAIAEFLKTRPDVRLAFEVRPRRDIIQRIATQRADLGFAFLADEHANVESIGFYKGQVVCIMQAGHPLAEKERITAEDLRGQPLITYSEEQGLRRVVDTALAGMRSYVDSVIEVGWVANAWALVNEGVGVALVDNFSRLDQVYGGLVTRPFEPAIPIVAQVLHPRSRPVSRLAAQFIQVARSVLTVEGERQL